MAPLSRQRRRAALQRRALRTPISLRHRKPRCPRFAWAGCPACRDLRPCSAQAIAALPFLPPVMQWVEAAGRPAIMNMTRAKQELGWAPRFTAIEALRGTPRAAVLPDNAG